MYKVKLPVFEGPFDLLLYLIKKNEIDIYDIPISTITEEYLQYMNLMQILDLEVAGEFIEMVATLILIKTRMLLPEKETGDVEDVEDPRHKLTMQLLEYKRFKEASGEFYDIETERRKYFSRKVPKKQKKKVVIEEEFEIEATLFDLLTAFKRALDNMPKITVHQVRQIKISIEDQVRVIVADMEKGKPVSFLKLVKHMPEKIYVVVTFMAILDLMKVGMITCKQSGTFEDIRLVPLGEISMSRYEQTREASELSFQYDPEQTSVGEEAVEDPENQDSTENPDSESGSS